jgi:uncharacterized membrane protein
MDGRAHFVAGPSACYGVVLLMSAIAHYILQRQIICSQDRESVLQKAIGKDWKGKIFPVTYVVAICGAFRSGWIVQGLYALAALTWFEPDRRIERAIEGKQAA